jgi:hypothetical protein
MALPLPVGGAAFAVAPFGRRVAALCVDAAILTVVLWALAIAVRGALGLPAFTVAPWIDPAVVEIDRKPVTVEDQRMFDNSGHRRVEFHVETRRYEDGTVRVYSVGEGVNTYDDGRVEPVRSELLIARNFRGLAQLIGAQIVLFALPFAYFAAFEASRRRSRRQSLERAARARPPVSENLRNRLDRIRLYAGLPQRFGSGVPRHSGGHARRARTDEIGRRGDRDG